MAVRIYMHQLELAEKALAGIKDGARIAARNAINRAMTAGKTAAIKKAAERYTIKQAKVRDKITTSKADLNRLVAKVTSRGKALRLTDYETNPKRPTPKKPQLLKVNVLRETGFQPIAGAFLAVSKRSGKMGVFVRSTKARLPIKQLFGPSIPEILGTKTVADAVEGRAQDVLNDRFNHEIGRLMRASLKR